MEDYLIINGTLLTLDPAQPLVDDGALLVRGGRIAELGPTGALRAAHPGAAVELDARGKVVLPGFVCAHHHLYSSMARGFAPPGDPAFSFAQILERLWWKLDRALTRDDVLQSALIALVECIRNGTTTIFDHHASPSCRDGILDVVADAVQRAGIRASLCYEVSDRNEPGAGVAENERFLRRLQREPSPLLHGMVGIHAAFTVGDETLARCRELAESLGAGYHIHVAEGMEDAEVARRDHGVRTVERLVERGICGPGTLFVHCVDVVDEEMDLLADSGVTVVTNPESNMNNAVGVTPVLELMHRGVPVCLGTDGMSSDMLAQMRCAFLVQRLRERDPRVAFAEAPATLLEHNQSLADAAFGARAGRVGRLAPGAAADLAVLDYRPPTPLTAGNVLGHLIFGMVDATVDSTVVAGRFLMRGKQLQTLDEERIAARGRELAPAVWQRIR